MRLVPHLRVQPAHHAAAAAAAGPQRVVGILGEEQMVRAEAGIDQSILACVAGSYTANCRPERSSGVSFAEGRLEPALQNAGIAAARMRDVNHTRPRSSNIGLWTVVWLSQIGSSPQNVEGCKRLRLPRRIRIAVRNLHLADGVVHRIEHRQIVAAFLGRSIDQAVRVDGRIALVGRDLVMQIGFRIGPVPLRDDDIALDALRPRRRCRPAVRRSRCGWSSRRTRPWRAAGRVASSPPIMALPAWPDCTRRIHACAGESRFANIGGNRARVFVAELMAGFAAIGLDQMEPLALVFDVRRDAVAGRPRAREFVLLRHFQQRVPVIRRDNIAPRLFASGATSGFRSTACRVRARLSANRPGRSRAPRPYIWPWAGRG